MRGFFNTLLEDVARARDLLAALALDGAGVPELLEAASAFVPGRLEAEVPHAGLRYLTSSSETGEVLPAFEVDISAGPERLGTIRLYAANADGVAGEILKYTAGLAANVVLRHQARSEDDLRARARVVESLIEGNGEEQEVNRVLGRIGVASGEPLVVLAVAPATERTRWAWLAIARAAAARRSVAVTAGGQIVVIGPGEDAEQAARDWHARYREAHADEDAPTVAAAVSQRGARDLKEASRRALRVLGFLLALGRPGTAASAEQLGILGLLLDAGARPDLDRFIERTLEPLIDRDKDAQVPLLPVLEAFIDNDGHLARAARALHIHVNTLYRRLEQVDALLGAGWRTGDRRLELALALRLRALERRLLGQSAGTARTADGSDEG